MVIRLVLYLVMALGVAGFIGVGWLAMNPPAPPPVVAVAQLPPVHRFVVVLTTARPLRAGVLIGPEDIATREVDLTPTETPPDTAVTRQSVLGGMVRHNMPAGTPLKADSVLLPNDRGFLAAVLKPGMRAVSVGVDAVSGAAGLIWPDDRVDVVLTQTGDPAQSPARRISGEVILSGLRVVAVDQQLMQGATGPENAEHNARALTQEAVARTVTLEVTAAEAVQIEVGVRLGHLSLAVHASPAGDPALGASEPRGVTWASDVSSALTNPARSSEPLHLYSGPDKMEEVHF